MLHHLVDAFSTWFFVSLFVVLIIELATTENESPGYGLLWLVVWLCAAVMFSDFRPWVWPIEHWLLSMLIFVVYVAAGIAWSLVKWMWHVADAVKNKFSSKDYLDPARSENKRRIVTWMMWWPFSVLWWLLKWPRQLFDALYDRMTVTFRRIVERAYPAERS